MPFDDESFSFDMTRFSFHHLIDPAEVLREIMRVCTRGGRVAVADVSPRPESAETFNRMEKLRDPSHVRAITSDELENVLADGGLRILGKSSYKLEVELDKQLGASFPRPGDAEEIRRMFRDDLGTNSMGVDAHIRKAKIRFAYPVTVIAGEKLRL